MQGFMTALLQKGNMYLPVYNNIKCDSSKMLALISAVFIYIYISGQCFNNFYVFPNIFFIFTESQYWWWLSTVFVQTKDMFQKVFLVNLARITGRGCRRVFLKGNRYQYRYQEVYAADSAMGPLWNVTFVLACSSCNKTSCERVQALSVACQIMCQCVMAGGNIGSFSRTVLEVCKHFPSHASGE